MPRFSLAPLLVLGLTTPAIAHTGLGQTFGFSAGLAHPFGGLDHAIAMLAVGLVAAQIGGRAQWVLPLSFLGTMAGGGMLGAAGLALPWVEAAIALSICAAGLALVCRPKLPLAACAGLTGAFALFHGHAHGAEMPEILSGLAYGAGFLVATAVLHTLGLAIGIVLGASPARSALRLAGGGVALAGLFILARAV